MSKAAKQLDEVTLGRICDLIFREGEFKNAPTFQGGIESFLKRAGVEYHVKHDGPLGSIPPMYYQGIPQDVVYKALLRWNHEAPGDILASSLEKLILRMSDPREHLGDSARTGQMIDCLDQILAVEGVHVTLSGTLPQLQEVEPHLRSPSPKPTTPQHQATPEFGRLTRDARLAEVLADRWREAEACVSAKAYRSAVVMMGSVMEGALTAFMESRRVESLGAASMPRDDNGNPRPVREWDLSTLIDVAYDLGWFSSDVHRFSHTLRRFRNIVHPYAERDSVDPPDADTCAICWKVVGAALGDLLDRAQGAGQ